VVPAPRYPVVRRPNIDRYLPTPEDPGRILLVDDLPGNLKVFERELKGSPFLLWQANSARDALEICRTVPLEGILMDVSLPGLDGVEACRLLREHGNFPLNAETPLIFISAVRVGEDWIARGIEAGAHDYLVRPYAFSELLAKLRMMVRLSRQRRAALAGERQQSLLEVAGGMAHELAQPLATAQVMLDRLARNPEPPGPRDLADLRRCLASAIEMLRKLQNLEAYVTKPYASGRILDLEESSRAPGEDGPAQVP
jgi:DNA-binding response OmpR family regulator